MAREEIRKQTEVAPKRRVISGTCRAGPIERAATALRATTLAGLSTGSQGFETGKFETCLSFDPIFMIIIFIATMITAVAIFYIGHKFAKTCALSHGLPGIARCNAEVEKLDGSKYNERIPTSIPASSKEIKTVYATCLNWHASRGKVHTNPPCTALHQKQTSEVIALELCKVCLASASFYGRE